MNKDLLKELKIKEDMMNKRDQEINGLVSEKQQMVNNKQELMTTIEEMKKQQLEDRKKLLLNKQSSSAGANVEHGPPAGSLTGDEADKLKKEAEDQK